MEIKDIIRAAGGPKKLASALGLHSHSTVTEWSAVPPKHVRTVAKMSGFACEQIRPDIFGDKIPCANKQSESV
jgi:DNA-binding transcriptional regulator YdaS (Cro superfamily)